MRSDRWKNEVFKYGMMRSFRDHCQKALKKGISLDGVPGFFINRDGDWEAAFYRKNNGDLAQSGMGRNGS